MYGRYTCILGARLLEFLNMAELCDRACMIPRRGVVKVGVIPYSGL